MEEIQQALNLKAQLDALRPIDKEQEARIMQKFRLDWNYHSNHLEGNSLTYSETKALLLFGVTAQGKPLKDTLEITGHNEAINWVLEMTQGERPLTENFIRELHSLLLKDSYKDSKNATGKIVPRKITSGKYKSTPNHVETVTGEIFYFASPEETPSKMYDLLNWYKEKTKDKEVNPLLVAAEFHYKFIRIHPFDDGNGRTARILMNFILMQFGFPPVIIKTEDKANYFAALQLADAGNIEPFINYIAINLNRSLEIMIAGANGEDIEEDEISNKIKELELKIKDLKSKNN
ncbi:Fic family protein [Flavobacterium sp.]|uniref:Fic family protein n=1 Tax=Flavobacterium sp. TaxID=239 RepID=UPI0037517601